MKKFDVHVCTISAQATPNYIPILDVDHRPKIVILLVSQPMTIQAENFKKVLKHYCSEVKIEQIDITNEHDFSSLKDTLFETISALNIPTEKVGFNITGGTKLMAIENYLLANDLECQPFYFDNNKVLYLRTQDNNEGALVLKGEDTEYLTPKNVTVEDYLELHGYRIKNEPTKKNELLSKETQELLIHLMSLSPSQRNSMTQFYGIISSNNQKQLKYSLADVKMYGALENIIDLFEEYNILKIEDNSIIFADEEDKKFAHGGWFEEYVFNEVKKMNGIQDCLMNIEIIESNLKNQTNIADKKTNNEVDVAYMKDNALHVIECKSKNYESRGNRSNNDIIGNGDLFKLETLQKLGGLYTQKIFISYLPVPQFMKDRSFFAGIKLIELDKNTNLKSLLAK